MIYYSVTTRKKNGVQYKNTRNVPPRLGGSSLKGTICIARNYLSTNAKAEHCPQPPTVANCIFYCGSKEHSEV